MSAKVARTKTALITGASSGIGLELAKLFAGDGYDVVLVARNVDRLAEIAKELETEHRISVRLIPKDLSSATAADEVYEELQRDGVVIDAVANCAGFGASGFFSEIEWAKEVAMIQVNIVALTQLSKLFLSDMLRRRDGRILNVASTAAFQPGPLMAVYYATKAYVLSFTEAIAEEANGSGVIVSALCPGPTRTGFQEVSGMANSRLFRAGGVMDAKTVARAGYQGLMSGERVVVPGLLNQLFVFGVRLVPRNFVVKIARRLNERS